MNFQPVIPIGGLPGWTFLNATLDNQKSTFDQSTRISRDTEYFEQTVTAGTTAEDLVNDRRLRRVALGAFGLLDDIDNRAFIRKILEDGSTADDALANRLTDDRYRQLAEAFGYGDFLGSRTGDPGFGAEITAKFRARQFEIAVGEQDQGLRIALNAERVLPDLIKDGSENTKWLRIMGDPPLREMFETALGLPTGFGQIDLDRQVEEFGDRASRQLGIDALSDLAEPDVMENLIQRFLLRQQIGDFTVQLSGSIALTLLQAG